MISRELEDVLNAADLERRRVERFILAPDDFSRLHEELTGEACSPARVPDIRGMKELPDTTGPKMFFRSVPVYVVKWRKIRI